MLSDYRNWLDGELTLLGNASHHAYSFGQANMAKRAIERLDQEVANRIPLLLPRSDATDVLTALEMLRQRDTSLAPALEKLRQSLQQALEAAAPPS